MKTKRVEYYRLWPRDEDGQGVGVWDIGPMDVPADTPDDKLDTVVRELAASIDWAFIWAAKRYGNSKPPIFVGVFYHDTSEEEECDGCEAGIQIGNSACSFQPPAGWTVVSRCEDCDVYSDDEEAAEIVSGEASLLVLWAG